MFGQIGSRHIVLENSRVKLVPFSGKYTSGLKSIIFDEDITDAVHCTTEQHFHDYIRQTMHSKREQNNYPFVIIDKQTSEVAGATNFLHISPQHKRLEIGSTWLGRPFRGTGLNLAVKFELLKYVFETMQFSSVQFRTAVDNVRAQRALEKCGAIRDGVQCSTELDHVGEGKNDVHYSMVESQWKDVKQTVFAAYL
ncbi:GNAT family N-acetyltransferase [Paenibacillus sp. 481]|uniref:GNAT family N-acetyltransferase n=1 Tax=Paenibacillus sp. 481 TaxID=2835869 RepID=UPI001E5E4DCA|nr:GNAT family protein [Paenibacillus sp. 481]UHA73658.1 GNAT family N-acetyltransferase [Paenibacillus sp. 481]